MSWKTATKITLSKKQERILREYAAGTHTPLHLRTRAQIILLAANGKSNNAIEREMELDSHTVKKWRDRYGARYEELHKIETETAYKTRNALETILSDQQRPGSPSKFKDEQIAAIIAMACEAPSKYDLPFSHWTPGLLQKEAIKAGIVENISVRQIGRFLKRERLTAAPQPVLAKP